MPIKECSITLSSNLFLSELVYNRSSINTQLTNLSDSILIDNTLSNIHFDIDGINNSDCVSLSTSEFDGLWQFWDRLYETEKSATFNYTPAFNDISNWSNHSEHPLRLSDDLLYEYPIEDSKVTCRMIFYPFGLFVIRLRVYTRFSRNIVLDDLISLINLFPWEIKQYSREPNQRILMSSGKSIFQRVFEQLLLEVFSPSQRTRSEIPDKYWGALGSVDIYPIIYIYDNTNLSDGEIAKLVKLDQRDLSSTYIENISGPSFGLLENDTIIVNKQGTVLQTPYFSDISPKNRRWKRIQLLNNAYLATELATFERNFGHRYINILQSTLDDLNTGTVTGEPIKPKYLVLMRESLLIGPRLRGIRNRMYDEIEPGSKQRHLKQINEYTDRIVDHSSIMREGIRAIAPSLLS